MMFLEPAFHIPPEVKELLLKASPATIDRNADIALIPEIVKAPDYAFIGIKRKNETFVVYGKFYGDNTTIY